MPEEPLHVVLGAAGRIGSAAVEALRGRGLPVRAVVRSAARGAGPAALGADPVVADLADPRSLGAALSAERPVRVLALVPPAPVDGDTDAVEHRVADAIVAALAAARPERVVAISTCGAREGTGIGDLGTLHRFERLLDGLDAPVVAVRAGYLHSNLDGLLEPVRADGRLPTMLDPGRPLPMVDPRDVGAEAARLLEAESPARGAIAVEGPERLSFHQVAAVFGRVLGRPVEVVRTPREEWVPAFLAAGFSRSAAESYAAMTRITDEEDWAAVDPVVRGRTTLEAHLTALRER